MLTDYHTGLVSWHHCADWTMWAGESKHFGLDDKTYMSIRGWEINPNKIQRPSTSVKSPSITWSGAWRGWPSKVKGELLHLPSPISQAEAYLDSGDSTFHTWVCYSGPYTKWLRKLLTLFWAWNRRWLFSRSRLLCRLLYHLDPVIQWPDGTLAVGSWSLWPCLLYEGHQAPLPVDCFFSHVSNSSAGPVLGSPSFPSQGHSCLWGQLAAYRACLLSLPNWHPGR